MAYKATLDFNGTKFSVMSASWQFSRSTDQKGRPSSGVYGGEVQLSVESNDETFLLKAMLVDFRKAVNATITFDKGTGDGELKKLEMKDVYITSYSEGMSFGGSDPGMINLTLTAREFDLKGAKHVNDWPGGAASTT